MSIQIACPDAADTMTVGRRLASLLQPGDVVLLAGPLGSGKTVFTAGLAEGLGVEERVTSPSFVLVRRYDGFLRLVHADVYRLGTMAELDDLDLDDAADGVLVVEWGHVVTGGLPADHLLVEFAVSNGSRTLRLTPRGSWLRRPLAEVRG